MSTISDGITTITPTLVLGYQSARPTRTIVHQLLGGDESVSLSSAGTRSGTLELFFLTDTASASAEIALAAPAVWTLTDPDNASTAMSFVVADGGIERELDDQTRQRWIVRVPFKEIA